MKDPSREDFKELYIINTISAVNRIKWRPGYPEQVTTTSSVPGEHSSWRRTTINTEEGERGASTFQTPPRRSDKAGKWTFYSC